MEGQLTIPTPRICALCGCPITNPDMAIHETQRECQEALLRRVQELEQKIHCMTCKILGVEEDRR